MRHDYRETLGIIEQQTARLSRIVDDMFTLARADAGNYPVRRDAMYLDEVIDEVVRAAQVMASTKNVDIVLHSIHSAMLTGDEDLIRRLVANLLDNAIRYSPTGSAVRIVLEQSGHGFAISVGRLRTGDSLRESSRTSSSASIESTTHAPGVSLTAAPGLAWRWFVGSPTCMAGRDADSLIDAGSTFTAVSPRTTEVLRHLSPVHALTRSLGG